MTQAEIEALLHEAFGQCLAEGHPLGERQKQILLQAIRMLIGNMPRSIPASESNPLDDLTPDQRQTLLQFVQEQDRPDYSWKISLLNDWLEGRDSGEMQFIREVYGLQWLERVQSVHLAEYLEAESIQLKVGDRIEVSNGLWEWVQEEGPCGREWFPCTVVAISESDQLSSNASSGVDCVVRFDNGMEYQIQGVYDWNRYNWRWVKA